MKELKQKRPTKQGDFKDRHPYLPLVISIIALIIAIMKPVVEKMI